jgi:DNA segregation ATPase FtsK/SpoIIIE, S-DNA-T family
VHGPTDMTRMVARMQEATQQLGMEPPRIPWLPVLSATYDLEDQRFIEALGFGRLVVGVADVPERQEQPVITFDPDQDGNLAIFGTGGSGKSAALRTLAVSAGLSLHEEHWQIYALDFAGGALATLEELPHVGSVIAADDTERVIRLMRQLEQVIDDRASRWAEVRAGSLDSYRELAHVPDEARILVLVDGLAAFRQEHEFAARGTTWERFVAMVAEGRQLGVHVAVTADRPATLASSIGSGIQRRLVLRLADENDYAMLGVPVDVMQPDSSPGRGLLDGHEVQVAVPGGVPSAVAQAAVIARIADELRSDGASSAPTVGRLPARVALSELPDSVGGLPVIGVSDTDLLPLAFDPRVAFLVSGPPRSGRTTALATLALSVRRWRPETRLIYLGQDRSPLITTVPWDAVATGADSIAALAKDLLAGLEDERVPLHYVVIERPADLSGTTAEMHVATLIGALRRHGHGVVGDGETAELTGFQEPLLSLRADRTGVALQPNSIDGDSLFQVPFGNVARAEFPPGRSFYVARGTVARAQLAVPE